MNAPDPELLCPAGELYAALAALRDTYCHVACGISVHTAACNAATAALKKAESR